MQVKMTPVWKLATFGASTLPFLAAIIGCAERGWHAPRGPVLAAIYIFGVALGIAVTFSRSRALEAAARERIRVAASACIDEKLRVALERVADDTIDDETLLKMER